MDERQETCANIQISVLMDDLNKCIKLLDHTQECLYKSHYEEVIREGRYQVLSIINQIKDRNCQRDSLVPKDDIERDIFMAEMECIHEETKTDHLRKEWGQQQNALAKMQDRFYKKCRLLSLRSRYNSTQGNALCAVLVKLMRNPELVECYLSEPDVYLKNFIKIADGCLYTFVKSSYALENPMEDSTDYRYVLALYTCILIISNTPKGRQFLLNREECQNMLSAIICILPRITFSIAKGLKITLLRILRNIKRDQDGVRLLRESSALLTTLNDLIQLEYDPNEYTYALELLECVTKNVRSKEYVDQITDTINMERLKELSGQMYEEVNTLPRKIFENIRISADKILNEEQKQAQGDVCKCKSADKHSDQEMHTPIDLTMPQKRSSKSASPCSKRRRSLTPTKIPIPISRTSRDNMFSDSAYSCKPHHSKERPSNIPVPTGCVPTCISRPWKPDINTNRSTPGHKSPRGSPFSSNPSFCCSKPSSNVSSGSGFHYIKDKVIELASSASRKLQSLIPGGPSHCAKSGQSKIPTKEGWKISFSKLPPRNEELACPCTTKNENRGTAPPSKLNRTCSPHSKAAYKTKKRNSVTSSAWRKSPNASKTGCKCVTTKSKATYATSEQILKCCLPSAGVQATENNICTDNSSAPGLSHTIAFTDASSSKISSGCSSICQNQTGAPYGRDPTTCLTAVNQALEHKIGIDKLSTPSLTYTISFKNTSSSSSKITSGCSSICQNQTNSPYGKDPTTCLTAVAQALEHKIGIDKPSTPGLPYTILLTNSSGSTMYSGCPSPCQKQIGTSYAKTLPIRLTARSSSLVKPIITYSSVNCSPVNSSPSINTECEGEICTCGSQSERRLVRWNPENCMISHLAERDRRVYHRGQHTIRIVSKIENNQSGRTPKIIARIRIPGIRFQRVVVKNTDRAI